MADLDVEGDRVTVTCYASKDKFDMLREQLSWLATVFAFPPRNRPSPMSLWSASTIQPGRWNSTP